MIERAPRAASAAELLHAGKIRRAYAASKRGLTEPAPMLGHPFRDGASPLDEARRWHEHGILCWQVAAFPEARDALRRAYATRRRLLGPDHAESLETLERLAALAHYCMDDAAIARFEAVLAGWLRLYGDEHVRVAVARRNFAACLRDRGRKRDARIQIEQANATFERVLPPEHADVVAGLKVEAMLLEGERAHHAAIERAERAAALGRRVWDFDHPYVAAAELIIARSELALGQRRRAARRTAAVVECFEVSYGDHPLTAIALSIAARADDSLERAEATMRRAQAMYAATYPEQVATFGSYLFEILIAAQRPVDAAEVARAHFPKLAPPQRLGAASRLANVFMRVGDLRAALPWIEAARDTSDEPELRARWEAALEHCRSRVS